MLHRFFSLLVVAGILAWCPTTVQAQAVVLQPASVSTTFLVQGGALGNTLNQSGLSAPYTSLITQFTPYISGNPTHDSSNPANYFSGVGSSGSFDFDLGGSFTIDAFVLWTDGSNLPSEIRGFILFAANNPSFTGSVSLGSFTADGPGPFSAVQSEVFSFTPTTASYLRMEVTSNNGGSATVLGEVAISAVPEPSSIILTLLAIAGAGCFRYRHRIMSLNEVN